jgi:hypothetical protein
MSFVGLVAITARSKRKMKKKRKAKKNAAHSLGNPRTESGLLSTLIKVVNFARVALSGH